MNLSARFSDLLLCSCCIVLRASLLTWRAHLINIHIQIIIIMLQLQIIGNLGADAEIKDFSGRKCVAFNVAHTERHKDAQGNQVESTTWVSCLWNSDGGKLLPYLKKGTQVFAEGSMSLRVYDSAKAHAKIAGANLSVRHLELVGGKKEDSPAPANEKGRLFPAPAENKDSDDLSF